MLKNSAGKFFALALTVLCSIGNLKTSVSDRVHTASIMYYSRILELQVNYR